MYEKWAQVCAFDWTQRDYKLKKKMWSHTCGLPQFLVCKKPVTKKKLLRINGKSYKWWVGELMSGNRRILLWPQGSRKGKWLTQADRVNELKDDRAWVSS